MGMIWYGAMIRRGIAQPETKGVNLSPCSECGVFVPAPDVICKECLDAWERNTAAKRIGKKGEEV